MGYHIHQTGCSFRILAKNFKKAYQAVKKLAGKEYRWVPKDFDEYPNFHSIMRAWRWWMVEDEKGNVKHIEFGGEKSGDDQILFEAIAPFVESGSFIDMMGEDGMCWRWAFDGKRCVKQSAFATEIEWLKWFYRNAYAYTDTKFSGNIYWKLMGAFEKETGKRVPAEYDDRPALTTASS